MDFYNKIEFICKAKGIAITSLLSKLNMSKANLRN